MSITWAGPGLSSARTSCPAQALSQQTSAPCSRGSAPCSLGPRGKTLELILDRPTLDSAGTLMDPRHMFLSQIPCAFRVRDGKEVWTGRLWGGSKESEGQGEKSGRR